ncbi:MAG: hypothetical protein JSV62_14475 [Promethearchaeota archaeon]|nr:MAG: hypothetical protein JSV62_14475 [Candidatus Lokiarchaeota archaeon]
MAFLENKISKSRKAFRTIFFIVCALFGIIIITAIHYKLLSDNQPGYPFYDFLINFFWLDVLIGLGIGLIFFMVIGIAIAYYFAVKEKKTLSE